MKLSTINIVLEQRIVAILFVAMFFTLLVFDLGVVFVNPLQHMFLAVHFFPEGALIAILCYRSERSGRHSVWMFGFVSALMFLTLTGLLYHFPRNYFGNSFSLFGTAFFLGVALAKIEELDEETKTLVGG